MLRHLTNIFLLLFIVGAAAAYFDYYSKPRSVELDVTERTALNILFIGNSYTFYNNMPDILEEIARHDPDSAFRVETKMITKGGATLSQMLAHPGVNRALQKKQWHYVVLQPQSLWAMRDARSRATYLALDKWNKKITAAGALPVFFMTWPRQPNTHWYTNIIGEDDFISPTNMLKNIREKSIEYTSIFDMTLVPVGEYWMHMLNMHTEPNLYNPDGSHPSQEGSYLAALLFHKMLVSETLDDITHYPQYLNEAERAAIYGVVSRTPPRPLK